VQITIARSGGYAGTVDEPVTVDTTQLDEATAKEIEDLVKNSGFFALPAQAGGAGADLFRHEVAITDDSGRTHVVTFVDDGSPETQSLRRLVETVSARV
jgi:hypothetical protein